MSEELAQSTGEMDTQSTGELDAQSTGELDTESAGEMEPRFTGPLTAKYQIKQEDLMSAIEAIDLCNRQGNRRMIHFMAVALVGYWSVDLVIKEPTFPYGWVMLAVTIALGFFVWREPRASNLRYTARYVQRAPEGTVTADASGFTLEDGTGRDAYYHGDGAKFYQYKNVLALDGGKKRFAMIPLDQLSETQREGLLNVARTGQFEKLEEKTTGAGFFRKKSL